MINYVCMGALIFPLVFGVYLLYSRLTLTYINRKVLNYGNLYINLISLILFSVSYFFIINSNIEFEYNLGNIFLNDLELNFGFLINKTNILFALIASLNFTLISLYSKFYFDKKKQFIFTKQRFYAFLSLLAFNTYIFLLSSNLFQLFVFWILQGIIIFIFSYFDIFKSSVNFNITRFNRITLIGNFALLLSIFILFKYSINQDFEQTSLSILNYQKLVNNMMSLSVGDIELKICTICLILASASRLIIFPFNCYYSFFANSSNIFYLCTSCTINSIFGLYVFLLAKTNISMLEYTKPLIIFFVVSSAISLILTIFEKNIKIIFGYFISAINGFCLAGILDYSKDISIITYFVCNLFILFALMFLFYNDEINIKPRFFTKQKGFIVEKTHIYVFEKLPDKLFKLLNIIDEIIVQNFILFFVNLFNFIVTLFVIKTRRKSKFIRIRNILLIFALMIIIAIFFALFGSGRFNAEFIG